MSAIPNLKPGKLEIWSFELQTIHEQVTNTRILAHYSRIRAEFVDGLPTY